MRNRSRSLTSQPPVHLLLILAFALSPLVASPVQATDYWIAKRDGLVRWSSQDNTVVTEVENIKNAEALSIDRDTGQAWIAQHKRITAFALSGQVRHKIAVEEVRGSSLAGFAVDGAIDRIFIAHGDTLQAYAISNGQLLFTERIKPKIRDLAIAPGRGVWALSRTRAMLVTVNGGIAERRNFRRDANPQQIEFDRTSASLWIAGDRYVSKVEQNGNNAERVRNPLEGRIVALRADRAGGAWIIGLHKASHLGTDLGFDTAFPTNRQGTNGGAPTNGRSIAAAPELDLPRRAWVGNRDRLRQFGTDGSLVEAISLEEIGDSSGKLINIVVAADTIPPEISFSVPAEGALISTTKPDLKLTFSDIGSGVDSTTLKLVDNSSALKADCEFTSGTATCSPTDGLGQGRRELKATIADLAGNVSDPAVRTVRVDSIAPEAPIESLLEVTPPDADGKVTVTGEEGSVESDTLVFVKNERTGVERSAQVGGQGAFSSVIAAEANDSLAVWAVDEAGNIGARTELVVPPPPLSVEIVTPDSSSRVTDGSVTVQGRYRGPANTGIRVNGRTAAVSPSGIFLANDVRVLEGEATLTAVATTLDGRRASQQVAFQNTIEEAAIDLSVEPLSGPAPLSTQLRIGGDIDPAAVAETRVDFQGDGIVDLTNSSLVREIEHEYQSAGLFSPEVTVITGDGRTLSSQSAVLSVDPNSLDNLFRSLWDQMNQALVEGDVPRALSHMTRSAAIRYEDTFEALVEKMPSIVDSYSELQRHQLHRDHASYAINRTIDGVNRLFFISFQRDFNGVWKVESM